MCFKTIIFFSFFHDNTSARCKVDTVVTICVSFVLVIGSTGDRLYMNAGIHWNRTETALEKNRQQDNAVFKKNPRLHKYTVSTESNVVPLPGLLWCPCYCGRSERKRPEAGGATNKRRKQKEGKDGVDKR